MKKLLLFALPFALLTAQTPAPAKKPATGTKRPAASRPAAKPGAGKAGAGKAAPKPAAKAAPAKPKPPERSILKPETLNETAPAVFLAKFETTKGPFTIEVHRDWAPLGADRFYNLVKNGYYDGLRFFRVVTGFMAQFGIHTQPAVNDAWERESSAIKDDPVQQSNQPGMVSFAMAGPDTRTTQIFINYIDNSRLDRMGFAPFGKVIEGMNVVEELFNEYGEGQPRGNGPSQELMNKEGDAYIEQSYPKLDRVLKATVAPAPAAAAQ